MNAAVVAVSALTSAVLAYVAFLLLVRLSVYAMNGIRGHTARWLFVYAYNTALVAICAGLAILLPIGLVDLAVSSSNAQLRRWAALAGCLGFALSWLLGIQSKAWSELRRTYSKLRLD